MHFWGQDGLKCFIVRVTLTQGFPTTGSQIFLNGFSTIKRKNLVIQNSWGQAKNVRCIRDFAITIKMSVANCHSL